MGGGGSVVVADGSTSRSRADFDDWVGPHLSVMRRAAVVAHPAGDPDEVVQDALLPTRQRKAVLLHYYVGLPVAEVAELMRCAQGTVKSTLSDARANLAKALGDSDE